MAYTPNNPNGQATSSNSAPVVIASDQSAVAVTTTDGGSPAIGATTDTAITTDANGSLSGKLRGLIKIFADVWDGVNHRLNVSTAPLVNTIDTVTSYVATDAVMNGTTTVPPKTAVGNVAQSQTDSVLVASVSGKKIRVVGVIAQTGSVSTTLVFNSKGSNAGTAISPVFQNGANGGEVMPFNPVGWFDTNAGEALTVTTGAGSTTGVLVRYIEA